MAKQQDCFAKLKEIGELYEGSIMPITLLEDYYNEKDESDKNVYNNLRNEAIKALACIMKMVNNANDVNIVEEMYSSAKSHLLRVGYDSYELIIRSYTLDIEKTLEPYTSDDISNGFPAYFQERLCAAIKDIPKKLTKYRESSTGYDQLLPMYQETFKELLKYSADIHKNIPVIDAFKEDREKKEKEILRKENEVKAANLRNYRVAVAGIIIMVAALIVALIGLFLH
jgi:DNA repair exonuclease SbcCD ATPase subunit